MRLLFSILILVVSTQIQAADSNIIEFKDWRADKVESHLVTGQAACVAQTTIRDKDMSLEVYAEANAKGGYVAPMIQLVTTELPPAVGAMARIDGIKMPMSISLKESKEIEVESTDAETGEPVIEKIERQVFVGKFDTKEQMIRFLRQKNKVEVVFYSATEEVGKETFSLRGSSRSISEMTKACL